MKKLLVLALMVSLTIISKSQWVSNYGGNSNRDDINLSNAKGLAVAADNSGNCYVTGLVSSDFNGNDIVVIKYNMLGDTLWTATFNGTANMDDQGTAIALDALGNVYVTGVANMAGDGNDLVLLKYNSSGSLLWQMTYSNNLTSSNAQGLALGIDSDGNIYLTGYCSNNSGFTGIITQKYSPDGTRLWSNEEHGPEGLDARGFGLAVDNAGNISVSGYCNTSSHGNDIIVVKYDGSGNRLWLQTRNGTGNGDDRALGIAVDASDNIYVTGYENTYHITNSNSDCALLKYNPNGQLVWEKLTNGLGNGEDKALGIAVDVSDGSIYITGYVTGITSSADYVTMKYSTDGAKLWSSCYNGPGNGDDKANSIALSGSGNSASVIVTGASCGTNGLHDYATLKIDGSNGNPVWVSRYSMSSISDDFAKAVTTRNGSVYLTGYSMLLINGRAPSSSISTLMLHLGESSVLNSLPDVPSAFSLSQNYPNPFNPSTTIKFNIAHASNVKLVIYDLLGREVNTLVNQYMAAGSYNIIFNTPNLASGIYFYELTAANFRDIKKMTLVK